MSTSPLQARLQNIRRRLLADPQQSAVENGIDLFGQGKTEEALNLFAKAIGEACTDARVFAYVAFIYAGEGFEAEATEFINQALALAPEQEQFRAALGEIFLRAGNTAAAIEHLDTAIHAKPEMFAAYPALAEAYRRQDQRTLAVQLLSGVVSVNSPAQSDIQNLLIEILAEQGDIESLAETCIRIRTNPTLHSLGIRLLAQTTDNLARINEESAWHANTFLDPLVTTVSFGIDSLPEDRPLRVGFLVSDMRREVNSGRLETLLLNLPCQAFATLVVDNAPQFESDANAQRYALVADRWLRIFGAEDAAAVREINAWQPDLLIDLDGHAAAQRLAVLAASSASVKLTVAQAQLSLEKGGAAANPTNPESGPNTTVWPLSHYALSAFPQIASDKTALASKFACLSPANQVGTTSWRLFAELLSHTPDSTLTINLGNLGEPAATFIAHCFAEQLVDRERLHFVNLGSTADYCLAWKNAMVGLAPVHGAGDIALPCALLMDTPVVAIRPPGAHSAAIALLEQAGCPQWIADSTEAFIATASALATVNHSHPLRMQFLSRCCRAPDQLGEALGQQLARLLRN